MRKNSPRKWVHAILDLLPLVLIPIFALAVRSDNNFQPIEITTGGYEYRNKYQTNEVNSYSDLKVNNLYHLDELTLYNLGSLGDFYFQVVNIEIIDYTSYTSRYEDDFMIFEYANSNNNYIGISFNIDQTTITMTNDNAYTSWVYEDSELTLNNFDFYVIESEDLTNMVTYMEDVGTNLPSPSNYQIIDYVYNEGVVYNDTDVGSQLVYTLYNASEKYFNFRQVGNFNDIYNWLETNMFNGNAPLIVPVVFNIILYELIMDIIFLLYAVFMFIVDFAERMLDCLFDKSFGGGK